MSFGAPVFQDFRKCHTAICLIAQPWIFDFVLSNAKALKHLKIEFKAIFSISVSQGAFYGQNHLAGGLGRACKAHRAQHHTHQTQSND